MTTVKSDIDKRIETRTGEILKDRSMTKAVIAGMLAEVEAGFDAAVEQSEDNRQRAKNLHGECVKKDNKILNLEEKLRQEKRDHASTRKDMLRAEGAAEILEVIVRKCIYSHYE